MRPAKSLRYTPANRSISERLRLAARLLFAGAVIGGCATPWKLGAPERSVPAERPAPSGESTAPAAPSARPDAPGDPASAGNPVRLPSGTTPPRNPEDLCSVFAEKPDWLEAAARSEERWGVPVPIQLAIIYRESRFRHDAVPRSKTVGTMYGYGQVIDSTWNHYRQRTGRLGARRDDFADTVDFIGWYADLLHRRVGIAKDDAHSLYLAYHEGPTGYRRGRYRSKPRLLEVTQRLERRAHRYRAQLETCHADLLSQDAR